MIPRRIGEAIPGPVRKRAALHSYTRPGRIVGAAPGAAGRPTGKGVKSALDPCRHLKESRADLTPLHTPWPARRG